MAILLRRISSEPGQSGNPRGRPKGSKNEATILRDLLNRKISVREGGTARKISILEAILLRFTEDALKGNVKTGILSFQSLRDNRLDRVVSRLDDDITEDDRKSPRCFCPAAGSKARTERFTNDRPSERT